MRKILSFNVMSINYFHIIGVIFFFFSLWWFCIYQPIERYLNKMQNNIHLSNQQYADMVNIQMVCHRLDNILAEFNVHMPSNSYSSGNTVSSFLAHIFNKKVEIKRYNLHNQQNKSTYKITPITVNKKTTLNDFINLHNQLYQQRVPVRCTKIMCKKNNDNNYDIICDYQLVKNKHFLKEPLNL
jgi:hypothetical protein